MKTLLLTLLFIQSSFAQLVIVPEIDKDKLKKIDQKKIDLLKNKDLIEEIRKKGSFGVRGGAPMPPIPKPKSPKPEYSYLCNATIEVNSVLGLFVSEAKDLLLSSNKIDNDHQIENDKWTHYIATHDMDEPIRIKEVNSNSLPYSLKLNLNLYDQYDHKDWTTQKLFIDLDYSLITNLDRASSGSKSCKGFDHCSTLKKEKEFDYSAIDSNWNLRLEVRDDSKKYFGSSLNIRLECETKYK